MLIVISPAKRLDWDTARHGDTDPVFQADANRLASHARQLPLRDLKHLMGLSDDLARLNRDRFRAFSDQPGETVTRAAAFAFAGDTYRGLEAPTLDADTLRVAQERLRILSGLYGVLRPLDRIQPYRLEMGSRLKTRRGKTLYDFWGPGLARRLSDEADALGTGWLLNCASQEYFGAVQAAALRVGVITPVFLEEQGDTARTIGFFAKRARGAMTRFALERRLTDPDGLKAFGIGGYRFDPARSDDARWAFVRPYDGAGSEAA